MTPLEIIAERLAQINIAGQDVDGVCRITTTEGCYPAITLSPEAAKVVAHAVLVMLRDPPTEELGGFFRLARMWRASIDTVTDGLPAFVLKLSPGWATIVFHGGMNLDVDWTTDKALATRFPVPPSPEWLKDVFGELGVVVEEA